MLIALDWIRARLAELAAFLEGVLRAVTLSAIRTAVSAPWTSLALSAAAALLLCFCGFFCCKWITGLTGAAVLGFLGWQLGGLIGRGTLSVRIILLLWMGILGFFFLFVVYPAVVLVSSFLLAHALCGALLPEAPLWASVCIALAAAVGWCALFVNARLVMSALCGAVLLLLTFWNAAPPTLCLAVCAGVLAGGIVTQLRLRRRQEEKRSRVQEEYRKKYIDCPSSRVSQLAALQKNAPGYAARG